MKYTVGVAVDGRVYIEVEANSFDEAADKANDMVCEINFGRLENINWNVANAEDEEGRFMMY